MFSVAVESVAGRLGILFVRRCNARPRQSHRWSDHSGLSMLFRVYGWWMIRVRDPMKHAARRQV